MRWGVTYSALLANGVFTLEVFLLTQNLLTLALALPIHGVCALRRELSAVDRIPYVAHVSSELVKTVYGDYVQVFRLGGASFECADDETLNTWHERLNVLWRNLASPQVALWAHVIRRREV